MIKNIFTVFLLLIACSFTFAKTSLHTKLHYMKKQINTTKKTLRSDQNMQHNVEQKLKAYERSIGHLSEEHENTQSKLNQKIILINTLKLEHEKLIAISQRQRHELNNLIKKVYMNGKINSQQTKNRMAVYEHYISKQYSEQLHEIKKTELELIWNKKKILDDATTLTKLRDKIKRQQQLLSRQKVLREQTLVTLASKIKSERDQLKKLKTDKSHLEQVIKNLQLSKTDTAKYFINHKKKMPWPAKGNIIVQFGDTIRDSHLHANGVEIEAPFNTPVHAIAPGKVVFNDWMPGFGLLLIIDHGHGYMSVYGHNNAIYKHLGDVVEAREMIAKVGSSGGIEKNELYFSIRYNGKPLSPSEWCV